MKKNIVMGLLLCGLCIGYASESTCFSIPGTSIGRAALSKIRTQQTKKIAAACIATAFFLLYARTTLSELHPSIEKIYTKAGQLTEDDADKIIDDSENCVKTKSINCEEFSADEIVKKPKKWKGFLGFAEAMAKVLDKTIKVVKNCGEVVNFAVYMVPQLGLE